MTELGYLVIFILVGMIRLKDLYDEGRFRNRKNLVHIMDVPMFSVFRDIELAADLPSEDELKTVFQDARTAIHKLGFPSMHANVVLADLSRIVNSNTGERGVGGQAHYRNKFMSIDVKNIYPSIVVHEWAHLWMMNNSKEFKTAVNAVYTHLRASGITKAKDNKGGRDFLEPDKSRKVLDLWANTFDNLKYDMSRGVSNLLFLRNKAMSPEVVPYLPQGITIEVTLKRDLDVQSLRGSHDTIHAGSEAYAEKSSDGWIIGHERDNVRYEKYIEGFNSIFDWAGGNILEKLASAYSQTKRRIRNRLAQSGRRIQDDIKDTLISKFDNAIQSIENYLRISIPTEDREKILSWISDFVYPRYVKLLSDPRYIPNENEKLYDYLWLNNDKVRNGRLSFMNLINGLIASKKLEASPRYTGKEFEFERDLMQKLTSWVNSYGMSNDDELWATAIEMFFDLSPSNRKLIIKLMMRIK